MRLSLVLTVVLSSSAMAALNIPTQQIAPGLHMPVISIGTWTEGTPANSSLIVDNWLSLGGRGIDTALIYFDQAEVAASIARSGVSRADIFMTTKIPGCADAANLIEKDLKDLNTTYLDLVLIHGPIGLSCAATWRAMEPFVQAGRVKAIGVSNFKQKDLEPILKIATVPIAVNQIEHNIFSHDDATVAFCKASNITVEAYSPLGSPGRHKTGPSVFTDPTVAKIAKAHNVSAPQVALRWIVQQGHVLTVLSERLDYDTEDANLFSFALSEAEMETLSKLANSTTY